MQFVVTADVSSDAGGNAAVVIARRSSRAALSRTSALARLTTPRSPSSLARPTRPTTRTCSGTVTRSPSRRRQRNPWRYGHGLPGFAGRRGSVPCASCAASTSPTTGSSAASICCTRSRRQSRMGGPPDLKGFSRRALPRISQRAGAFSRRSLNVPDRADPQGQTTGLRGGQHRQELAALQAAGYVLDVPINAAPADGGDKASLPVAPQSEPAQRPLPWKKPARCWMPKGIPYDRRLGLARLTGRSMAGARDIIHGALGFRLNQFVPWRDGGCRPVQSVP